MLVAGTEEAILAVNSEKLKISVNSELSSQEVTYEDEQTQTFIFATEFAKM